MRLLTAAWYHSYNIDGGRSLSSASEHSTQFNCRRSLYTLNIQYIVLKLYLLFQSFEYLSLSLSLFGLNREEGKNQLWDRFALSPHTLYVYESRQRRILESNKGVSLLLYPRAEDESVCYQPVAFWLEAIWARISGLRNITQKKNLYMRDAKRWGDLERCVKNMRERERDARNDDGWCDFELQMLWNEAHLWVWRGNGILYLFKVVSNVYT